MENEINVLILTEGGKNIGFGHISRCFSLYQAFKQKSATVDFIINGDKSVADFDSNEYLKILNWLDDPSVIMNKAEMYDIVIIDSYLADESIYKRISETVRIPVYIDDNVRIDYPAGIVINGNVGSEYLDYPEKKGVRYLLGERYIPLRKAFWETRQKKIRKTVDNVMITFGGEDIQNVTPKVLKLLSERYSSLSKNIIIGKGFGNTDEIKKHANGCTELIFSPDEYQMRDIMLNADFAISAAGQTLHELATVGLPTIMIQVADNQKNNVKFYKSRGLALSAGTYSDDHLLENLCKRIEDIHSYEKRQELNKNCSQIDGSGALNIVNTLEMSLED